MEGYVWVQELAAFCTCCVYLRMKKKRIEKKRNCDCDYNRDLDYDKKKYYRDNDYDPKIIIMTFIIIETTTAIITSII